jgi:diaminohydroxyphosphoribosylaminopyrimidine deaminase/5-amino-6-(5-phosphoribosylamino)uracil reductase
MVNVHEKYIRRCIELAKNGFGTTYPNPMVGSVVVYEDKIIGEGWHQIAGGPHAEVNAIRSVKDKSLLKKATIYVSLEPCSHYGKTPPCCDLIIENGIPNVVVGTVDPHEKVAGKGIKRILATGATVVTGILEAECNVLNKRFFTFHQKKRPYIILKWAESEDGFIAPDPQDRESRKPVWITNIYSRQLVHKWRSEENAILVGTTTVAADNPKLNVRDWSGNNPVRIIIDQYNRIPKESFVLDDSVPTLIFTKSETGLSTENTTFEIIDFNQDIIPQILQVLYQRQIQSVIIEGGQRTLQSFIDLNLWDEARIFRGKISISNGIAAPRIERRKATIMNIEGDELIQITNHD